MYIQTNFHFSYYPEISPLTLSALLVYKIRIYGKNVYKAFVTRDSLNSYRQKEIISETCVKIYQSIKTYLKMEFQQLFYRGNGWIGDRFNTTPIMSTYLLALIVCDFNYTSNVTANGIEVCRSGYE